jgi:hypothetical protein
MVREHRFALAELLAAADEFLVLTTVDDPGRPSVGLALVMFSGVAVALGAQEFVFEPLSEALRLVSLETVAAAMSTAAGCLEKVGEMVGLAGAMASVLSGVLEP